MTVQILKSFISSDSVFTPGVVTEVEDAMATEWIAAGLVAPVLVTPVNPKS